MLSFEERLATFQNWPRKFTETFINNLCVLGHYSIRELTEGFITKCIYCDSEHNNWDINDDPFTEHKNSNCPIFSLHTKIGREKVNSLTNFSCSCKAICIELRKNTKFIFCPSCGKNKEFSDIESALVHSCCDCVSVKKITAKSNNYYVDFFKGRYNSMILQYLNPKSLSINESDLDLIEYVVSNSNTSLLSPAIESIEIGLNKLAKEIESECVKIEKEKISKIELV
ncbi:hypothetical protein HERIO_1654 [Hepatospora eriocheir]|uniref:Uncharacterized protein n=1 Tax=Hepatospora eriocheir TaxID=1081669 RepID=A0A1X0Q9I4_9MICR|nr:hypothetical protein HERIO_1654 [Hepatospora eriocheir]